MTIIRDPGREQVRNFNKLRLSKIQSTRRQLQNLVAKRLRLDVEIKNLTRALRKQTVPPKVNNRSLRESGLDESLMAMAADDWESDPDVVAEVHETLAQLNEVNALLASSGNLFRSV